MKYTYPSGSTPLAGYTIKRAIHRGGFGEVYLAWSDAGKEVALKLLHSHVEIELRGVSQCLNLKHRNLIALHDVKRDDTGDTWVVMEFVAGEPLSQRLRQCPNGLPREEVRDWMVGLCEGLDYLHANGIVHRDLKPGNLFRDSDGTVKIGDVGLSKAIAADHRSTQTTSVGTVSYMAPEIGRGRYGRGVDLYSVGVVLHEMLTGTVPFEGESAGEILMKHLTATPDLDAVPSAYRSLIGGLLAKEPSERPPSARAVLRDFERAYTRSDVPQARPKRKTGSSHRPEQAYNETVVPTNRHLPAGCGYRTDPTPWGSFGERLTRGSVFGMAAVVLFAMLFGWPIALISVVLGVLASPLLLMHFAYKSYMDRPRQLAGDRSRATQRHVPAISAVRTPPPRLTPESFRSIPATERLSQLSGSLVLGLLLTAFFGGLTVWTTGWHQDLGAMTHFLAVLAVSVVAILAASKALEGRTISGGYRRLLFLGCGLGVGAVGWFLQEWFLLAQIDPLSTTSPGLRSLGKNELIVAGTPTLFGYLAFFGSLFAGRRWWRQADGLRSRRFRVVSVLATSIAGGTVLFFFAFPLLTGLLWAVLTSCVVQLSAGWIDPTHRSRMIRSPQLAVP